MSEENILKIKTGDGDIISVDINVAKQWKPITTMLEVLDSAEARAKPIELDLIGTTALNKIIEWVNHYNPVEPNADVTSNQSTRFGRISDWDKEFFNVRQEMIFEIIVASDHLGMIDLLDTGCKIVADMIKGKTPDQVRELFNIENDLPPMPTLESISLTPNQ